MKQPLNIYGRPINGLIDTWWYFPNPYLTRQDISSYSSLEQKRIIANTKELILQFSPKLFNISEEQLNNYIYELEQYLPLSLAEEIWYYAFQWVMLYITIRCLKPKILIETGCDVGWSTTFQALALKLNKKGKLYVLDIIEKGQSINSKEWNQGYIETSRGKKKCQQKDASILETLPANLFKYIEYIPGDTKVTLPKLLKQLKEIDYFFHDSDHSEEHMKFEFETVFPYIKRNGIIASHDVSFNNAWTNFIKDYDVFEMFRFDMGIAKKK